MNTIKAGFSRIDITPPLGIYISGYYEPRQAQGMLDPLMASALALQDDQETAIVFSLDVIGIAQNVLDTMRKRIAATCGLARCQIFVACTHIHTGPEITGRLFPIDQAYNERLVHLLSQAAIAALHDLKPATVRVGRNEAPGISFIRRFRMKDGSVRTNPGINNPDVLSAIGTPDETVQIVRIEREQAREILLVNFQVHPDVVKGNLFSADYIKFVRDTLENALPQTCCLYLNGAQGDVNHINIHPDDASLACYEQACHMGRVIAGAVLQVYSRAQPVAACGVGASESTLLVKVNKGDPEKLPEARRIIELHDSGKTDQIPGQGMGKTTQVAEAHRMLRLADGPDTLPLNMTAVRFGDVCIAGIPGEPFTGIGRGIKGQSPFAMQIVCCCANGYEGYFPMQDAFDEGGYEARSSSFKPGVAENIIAASIANIRSLTPQNERV
ncbi:MAG: hypothetical protein SCM11_10365 [Bacillota bacterium]|nr:hypothetical protein [Bacillota bacterium]